MYRQTSNDTARCIKEVKTRRCENLAMIIEQKAVSLSEANRT